MNPWGLTAREAEVLDHLVRLHSCKAVGKELGIAEQTVRAHLEHIRRRAGPMTIVGLALAWDRFRSERAAA